MKSVHNQYLAEWLDGQNTYPINLDGPVVQERDGQESIHEYIESTMRKDRENIKMKGTLTNEDVNALVKAADANEQQKVKLADLLKEFKVILSPGFCGEQPAGSSFFILHTIKLTHDAPVW